MLSLTMFLVFNNELQLRIILDCSFDWRDEAILKNWNKAQNRLVWNQFQSEIVFNEDDKVVSLLYQYFSRFEKLLH